MKNFIISILMLSTVCIVLFVNFYNFNHKHIWNLVYYSQYYFIVAGFIVLIWVCFKDMIIRSLTIPIGFYYIFHLIVQTIEIFDPILKQAIYKGKIINYILAIGCGGALLIYPLIIYIKKWKKS